MTDSELLNLAKSAAENAYSPYSGYRVGAVLVCKNGEVYCGCNVENSSYSATVCAERTAVLKAVSDGITDFSSIALIGLKDGIVQNNFTPCGVCLQVLSEFCGRDFKIIIGKNINEYETKTLGELMPYGFSIR